MYNAIVSGGFTFPTILQFRYARLIHANLLHRDRYKRNTFINKIYKYLICCMSCIYDYITNYPARLSLQFSPHILSVPFSPHLTDIYICIYVCMYACMYVYMYVCMYVIHVYMYVCMYGYLYAWYVYICMYISIYYM